MTIGKNNIGYNLSAEGDVQYTTLNPATNEDHATVLHEATSHEIDKACKLAAQSFKTYRKMPGIKRSAFLEAIAEEILALGDTLLDTYVSESGLPKGRAEGERGRTIGQLKLFADLVKKDVWREPTTKSADSNIRKMLVPIGPVAVFGASNFPLAFSTAGGDTASALAAGNPVVVKSHPMHAQTSALVAAAIINAAHKTGMPDGVFSHLNGKSNAVGAQLVQNAHIKAVGFTGSFKGGRALYNLAAQREEPIPVFAEMGSINPVVITQKALETRSAEIANTYADSIAVGVGQFCTNPGLLLVVKSEEASAFIENLGSKLAKTLPAPMLHPNIFMGYMEHKSKAINEKNVVVVGEADEVSLPNAAQAALVTVDGSVFMENKNLHQEVFGPFSMVVQCDSLKHMAEIIEHMDGQLTGTIMAEKSDVNQLIDVFDALQDRVGRVVFNGVPTGVEVCEAMTHGGPYPASTDSRFTAVGTHAIKRWVRPFSFQNIPDQWLPNFLK